MGKKSKKQEPGEVNFDSETNSHTDSFKKSKKQKRKRDLNDTIQEDAPLQIKIEDINETILENPSTMKIKKKKMKKHTKLNEEELCEEVQNDTDTNKLFEDQLVVPKKKKKKNKLLDEKVTTIETCVQIEEYIPQTDSKEEKDRNISSNEPNFDKGKDPNIKNEDTKQKKKKGKKKARTGTPVLKDEESQVTEEDIDRFIDELDEEDNKQYEEWVKLLDARLRKKQKTE